MAVDEYTAISPKGIKILLSPRIAEGSNDFERVEWPYV